MSGISSMKRVIHLTSVHPRNDTRIFLKECRSLAQYGYNTSLVVADNKGNTLKDGVYIYDVGSCVGRLNRICKTSRRVYKLALSLDGDIYHIHDPELIPVGLKLLKKKKKVIFDAHEDLPKQILSKPYLCPWQAKFLSVAAKKYEKYALHKFSGIITATPFIRDKFLAIHAHVVDVNNFPLLGELSEAEKPVEWGQQKNSVCYIGGLSKIRGIKEIVSAMAEAQQPVRLQLAGAFGESLFEQKIKKLPAWRLVDDLGYLDREGVRAVLQRSLAGLVTLHPVINYVDALPVKMFEYMSAGLPVIASHFPLWKEIIEGHDCGICVDPLDPNAIAEAIDYLVLHPEIAQRMGKNGREAVVSRYNWEFEEKKLIACYEKIFQG